MKLFAFERRYIKVEDFIKEINEWVSLHKEITIVDYDCSYNDVGQLQTVVVKWK